MPAPFFCSSLFSPHQHLSVPCTCQPVLLPVCYSVPSSSNLAFCLYNFASLIKHHLLSFLSARHTHTRVSLAGQRLRCVVEFLVCHPSRVPLRGETGGGVLAAYLTEHLRRAWDPITCWLDLPTCPCYRGHLAVYVFFSNNAGKETHRHTHAHAHPLHVKFMFAKRFIREIRERE